MHFRIAQHLRRSIFQKALQASVKWHSATAICSAKFILAEQLKNLTALRLQTLGAGIWEETYHTPSTFIALANKLQIKNTKDSFRAILCVLWTVEDLAASRSRSYSTVHWTAIHSVRAASLRRSLKSSFSSFLIMKMFCKVPVISSLFSRLL